jgi:hypothetical protein
MMRLLNDMKYVLLATRLSKPPIEFVRYRTLFAQTIRAVLRHVRYPRQLPPILRIKLAALVSRAYNQHSQKVPVMYILSHEVASSL